MSNEIRARSADWGKYIDLIIKRGDEFVVDMTFEKVERGAYISPSVSIEMHYAQALMDDLWAAGLRPTEGTGSAGSLAATQNHLADMRKIAFSRLKIS